MKKRLACSLAGTAALLCALWLGGVALTAAVTAPLLARQLMQLDEQVLARDPGGLLRLRLHCRYEVLERHLFREQGHIILQVEGVPRNFEVPVQVHHGFLRASGSADVSAAAEALAGAGSIFRSGFRAAAGFKAGIFPARFDLKFKLEGGYSPEYAPRSCRGRASSRPLRVSFSLHRGALGRISAYLDARELRAPWGCLDRFTAKTVTAPGEPGSLSCNGRGVEAEGALLQEAEAFRIELAGVKSQSGRTFRVDYAAAASGSRGRLRLAGSLGPFCAELPECQDMPEGADRPDLQKDAACASLSGYAALPGCSCNCSSGTGRKTLLDLTAAPAAAGRWFAAESGWLRLKRLDLEADYPGGPQGQEPVKFSLGAQGGFRLPRTENFLSSAGRIDGSLRVVFVPRSEGAERLLQAAGAEFFIKQGERYFVRLDLREGRMLLNGSAL